VRSVGPIGIFLVERPAKRLADLSYVKQLPRRCCPGTGGRQLGTHRFQDTARDRLAKLAHELVQGAAHVVLAGAAIAEYPTRQCGRGEAPVRRACCYPHQQERY
jgi:hypothetical protein